jgi:hypothetical protein
MLLIHRICKIAYLRQIGTTGNSRMAVMRSHEMQRRSSTRAWRGLPYFFLCFSSASTTFADRLNIWMLSASVV